MRPSFFLLFVPVAMLALAPVADACLTFRLKSTDSCVFGRNFDWPVEAGILVLNPRGISKTAYVRAPAKPVAWTSRYGSLTFSEFGKEFPVGGMNEEGLVIECLLCPLSTEPADTRPAINELQWIQYHLDSCATVDEVIAATAAVRREEVALSLHYFIADKTGACAAIEWKAGRLIVKKGPEMPAKVLANGFYTADLAVDPQERFARAQRRILAFDGKSDAEKYAFETLDAVSLGERTKWQIVHDPARRRVSLRTRTFPEIRTIDLSAIDFSKMKNSRWKFISADASAPFAELTAPLNDRMIALGAGALGKSGVITRLTGEDIKAIRELVPLFHGEEQVTGTTHPNQPH